MMSRDERKPSMIDRGHHAHSSGQAPGGEEHRVIEHDLVCGMEVDTRTATHKLQLGDSAYSFCSRGCLERFKADPGHYLNPQKHDAVVQRPANGALAEGMEGTIWTCPMHPQIRRN